MAKTNFSYEKRQRELEKKKKAEEKAKRKAEAKANPGMAVHPDDADDAVETDTDIERASPQEESPI
jgi:hypothetical protein